MNFLIVTVIGLLAILILFVLVSGIIFFFIWINDKISERTGAGLISWFFAILIFCVMIIICYAVGTIVNGWLK